MKKSLKVLIFALSLMLMLSLVLVFASASESKEYAYTIAYWEEGKESSKKTLSGNDGSDFFNSFSSIALGKSQSQRYIVKVKLNADITDAKLSVRIPSNSKVYIDLAGYKYAYAGGLSSGSMFQTVYSADSTEYTADNSDIYFYSSREGGQMFHACTNKTKEILGHAIIVLNSEGTTVNMGEATVDGVTYSGDNFSVYTSILVDASNAKSVHNTLNIKGGQYYRIAQGSIALIVNRSSAEMNIEDAFLYSKSSPIFSFYNGVNSNGVTYAGDGKINVKSSVLYMGSLAEEAVTHFNETSTLVFEDCYITTNMLSGDYDSSASGKKEGKIVYKNCYFADTAVYAPSEGYEVVKCHVYKEIPYSLNTFAFDYVTNASGTVTSATMNPSSYNLTEYTLKLVFTHAITDSENCSEITWITPDRDTITEKWLNGCTPMPPANLPADTDIYRFAYANIEPASGDVTYSAKQYVNFPIKANITLYTDFVYNVYIPASYRSYVNSVVFGGKTLKFGETVVVSGVEYYIFSHEILAAKATDGVKLVLNVDGYQGEAFEQVYSVSIPAYATSIISGAYNEEAKLLMKTTMAYVRSAVDYVGGDTSSIDSISGVVDAPVSDEIAPPTSAPTAFTALFSNVQLSISGSVGIRFNVNPNATKGTADFSYLVDGVRKSVTVTEKDWQGTAGAYYYDITMRARDLASTIIIKVGNTSYSYSLGNYVYSVNNTLNASNTQNYAKLKTLVNNLYAYSKASEGYKYETPDVNITINNNPISDYVIVAEGEKQNSTAELLQSAILAKTGYKLPIATASVSGKRSIVITLKSGLEDREYSYDFKIYEDGGNLYVKCEYASFILAGMGEFVNDYITPLNTDLNIESGFAQIYNTDRIYYSDFGAKGDAVLDNSSGIYVATATDDFVSMRATHNVANNTMRHTVYADEGASYYISNTAPDGKVERINIKTNTVWKGAQIIIDDTNLHASDAVKTYAGHVFYIGASTKSYTIVNPDVLSSLAGIGPDTTRIDVGINSPAMLNIQNSSKKFYIRYGGNANSGSEQHELVVVDKNGYIKKGTELLFAYDKVTAVTVYPAEPTPLVLEGGTVITLATRQDTTVTLEDGTTKNYKTYFNRGLQVERSNTTVRGLEHKVYNEFTVAEQNSGLTGPPYHGFFGASAADGITFEDCIIPARRYYKNAGTYGFSANLVNNIVLKNCTQPNFYKPGTTTLSTSGSEYWGLGGTNYCKNMVYDSCMLTRYDAHSGVYNGKIINSTVAMVNLIGGGEMLIEDSVIMDSTFVTLRTDYGATFNGVIKIKNSTLKNTQTTPHIVDIVWTNHNFGYTCYFPNFVLDGIRLENPKTSTLKLLSCSWRYDVKESKEDIEYENAYGGYKDGIHLPVLPVHVNYAGETEYNVTNKNPVVPPQYVKIYNNVYGVTLDFSEERASDFFAKTKFVDYTYGIDIDSLDTPLMDFKRKDAVK